LITNWIKTEIWPNVTISVAA